MLNWSGFQGIAYSLDLIGEQMNLAKTLSKAASPVELLVTLGIVVVYYGALFYILVCSCGCFPLVEKNFVLERHSGFRKRSISYLTEGIGLFWDVQRKRRRKKTYDE